MEVLQYTQRKIPEGWDEKRLGDALTLKRGHDLTNGERLQGDVPVISSSGYNGYHKYSKAPAPGIVMGRYGTLGEIYFINEAFWPHNTTLYVSLFKLVIPRYAFYLLQSINYEAYSAKSAVPGLNRNDLHLEKVLVPPPDEQKAIAQVLSTWDKAIENLTQLITEKQQKKKALMQQLLTGKKRFPGFDGEWKEVKLGEYFTERKESKRPDLPLLSIGSSGVYPQTDSNKKDTSNSDKAKYKRICPDDIGYNTMRMWQGRSALSSLEGIVSPAYTIVTPKENSDVLFFSYLFKFPYVVHRFFRNSQGLVDDTLNCKFKDFAIVKVMVPPTKEEQTKIAQVLKNADEEIKILEKKKEHLQDQKKGLMQQLLTGKKRLKF